MFVFNDYDTKLCWFAKWGKCIVTYGQDYMQNSDERQKDHKNPAGYNR